jgi:hypothetical protein
MAGLYSPLRPLERSNRVPVLGAFQRSRERGVDNSQTLHALNEHGDDGWLVLEQDTAVVADEPAVTSTSMLTARHSIGCNNSAHRTEEINR